MDTNRRFRVTLADGSTLTVCAVYRQPGAIISDPGGFWRRRYGFRLTTPHGVVTDYGIGGPAYRYRDGDAPPAREIASTALSFLLDAAEHYRCRMAAGTYSDVHYRPRLATEAEDEIAYMVDSELEALACELGERVSA